MTQSNAPQTILEQIAERIVSFDLKAITPQAIMLSRTAIIDTLGVTLAGAIEPCTTNLLRTPGVASAPGICTIFGTSQKTSALDAPLLMARLRTPWITMTLVSQWAAINPPRWSPRSWLSPKSAAPLACN